jgi:hypothetical protein
LLEVIPFDDFKCIGIVAFFSLDLTSPAAMTFIQYTFLEAAFIISLTLNITASFHFVSQNGGAFML